MDTESLKRWFEAHLGAVVAGSLTLLVAALVTWPTSRKPHAVTASIEPPPATSLEEGSRPQPAAIEFSAPVARLDAVGKTAAGVTMQPPLPGEWVWVSDRRLVFTPRQDWPVGRQLVVRFETKSLAQGVVLAWPSVTFPTPAFTARLAGAEFSVDPQDSAIKRVTATLVFSHPIDADEVSRRLTLELEEPRRALFAANARVAFNVTTDKRAGKAFIQSEPLAVPKKDTVLRLTLAPGLSARAGGPGLKEPIATSVLVPGRYSLLRVNGADVQIVRNDRQEPEQALMIEATTGVDDEPMAAAVSAWVLPTSLPKTLDRAVQNDIRYWDASQVDPAVLALSSRVALGALPSEHPHALVHAFKLDVPPKRWLYVEVAKNLEGYGGYAMVRRYAQAIQIPEYPRQLKIIHEGAVLSSAGQRALSLAAEGVEHVRFELARVLPARISLLASQTEGRFSDPRFTAYEFGPDDLAERFEQTRALPAVKPGRVNYFAFDFSPYLHGRHGLFFFRAQRWDPARKVAEEPEDHRLILVTDLGLLSKENADGSRDVFVQSLSSGKPAAGARIEVVGRNGLPVVTAETDASGRAHLPRLSEFKREKQPVAYVAKLGDDLSLLPFSRSDRRLDFSRFDVGGVFSHGKTDALQAYMFTDRGLYRPGETVRAAAIVRSPDWASPAGVPVEIIVTDPRGLEVQRTKIALSSAAFEEVSFKTEDNAPTGGYGFSLYTLKDGRRAALLGSTQARVEEFLPDRLRIRTRLSAEREQGWASPDDLKAFVSLKTLFGSDAEGRTVSARFSLTPAAPKLPAFPGFLFFDPSTAKKSFSERLPDAVTDERGEASFPLDLSRFEAATYRLAFTAEGFEAGSGRGVAGESAVVISPRPYLVGLKPDGDLSFVRRGSTRSVEAAAVGPDGAARAADGLWLSVVETRHVSALVKQEDGLYKYQSVEREILVSSAAWSLPAAAVKVALPTAAPGDFALIVRDASGLKLNRLAFCVAGSADVSRALDRNAELQIRLDRQDYAPGQEIAVHVRAPYRGAGLITIERDRVYSHKWFSAGTTASVQTIRLPEAVEGNGYVAVQFLRAPDSPEIFMSPLSHGAAPFTVSRARRTLGLELQAPAQIRPGQTLKVRARAPRGARLIVWGVDEGILQAAGYSNPDPLAFFFQKRALEVSTFQILDLLLPEYGVARAALAPGGDKGAEALGRNLNPFKRKTDPPAAFWSGLVTVQGDNGYEYEWVVPESFNGSLRILAVAAAPGALSAAAAQTTVRAPIVVLAQAPLFAAPGDEFELTASVVNTVPGSGPQARLDVSAAASGHLEALGPVKTALDIPEGRERAATFRFRAKQALGSASVRVTATLAAESSAQTVTLSVRPASPHETTIAGGFLRRGRATAQTPRRLFPQYRVMEASASVMPLALARGLLAYLTSYPHGCTEQLVSQAFPALALRRRPEFGYAPERVAAALDRVVRVLRSRQNAEGAFGYWAASAEYDAHVSVYAMHFLTEAKDADQAVPAELMSRGLAFLSTIGEEGSEPAAPRTRAYALYVLTRNGRVTTDKLEALRRDTENDPAFRRDIGAAYMAASYKMLRLDSQAERMIKGLALGQLQPGDCDYDLFYDGFSRDAQLLYLWARHFPGRLRAVDDEQWQKLVEPITLNRYNTQSSAYAILAFEAAASTLEGPGAGDKVRAVESGPAGRRPLPLSNGLFRTAELSPSATQTSFESDADVMVFYAATQSGFDLEPSKSERRDKIEVQRAYLDERGREIAEASVGQQVVVRLRARTLSQDHIPRVALVDLLPAGLEAIGEREEPVEGSWRPDYSETREDRVIAYGSLGRDAAEFSYKARAVARGRFTAPPAYAESMYDRGAVARTVAGTFDVR